MPGTCLLVLLGSTRNNEALEALVARQGWRLAYPTPIDRASPARDAVIVLTGKGPPCRADRAGHVLKLRHEPRRRLPDGWERDVLDFLAACDPGGEASDETPLGPPEASAVPTSAAADPVGCGVFISYSRHDQDYVDRLVAHLNDATVACWIDKSGIDYGTRYDKEIRSNLDACSAFVVVMTLASDESAWVTREIERAEQKGKPILPLLLEGEPFFRLGDLQHESVVGGEMPSKAWVESVKRIVSGAESSGQSPTPATH